MTDDNEFVFVSLGGLGEIGMNCALYGYGPASARKWLMVDLGVGFAGEDLPGVDLVMPNLDFIEKAKKDLVGIVEARRLGEPGAPKIALTVVGLGESVGIGPFVVEFIAVAHSIPESSAL